MVQSVILMEIEFGTSYLKNGIKMVEEVVGQSQKQNLKECFVGLILKMLCFQDIIGGDLIGITFILARC